MLLIMITAALLASACERTPTPLAMGSPEAVVRPGAARPGANPPGPATAAAPPAVAAASGPLPPPDALTDAAITGKIRSALIADPGMEGADVSINTDKGVVVLAGTVKSHEQTGIASAHAQRQDGVIRVDNHLRPELS